MRWRILTPVEYIDLEVDEVFSDEDGALVALIGENAVAQFAPQGWLNAVLLDAVAKDGQQKKAYH